VTAADLRVAQGYVRCGRCSSVFNALARLSDERQAAITGGEPETAPAAGPETLADDERADLSPLEEALSRPDDAETPELPATAEQPLSDDALEFDPETTDVGAVFVQPPPNPQWAAATGSFKAMRAASQESAPEEPAPGAVGDSQLDVEIDAAFLAEMLREASPRDPAGLLPSEAPPSEPARSEPPPAKLPRSAPAPPSRQHAPPPSAPPPSAPPTSTRAPRDSEPDQGKTAAAAATRGAAHPGGGTRPPARHAAPHTRPPAGASARLRSDAAREAEPPARESQTLEATEGAIPATLDLDADEIAAAPRGFAARLRLARWDPRIWGAGVVLGVLVLAAQIVNHYRDELAATPRFSRPLTAFYASLGVQLVPRWHLRAYDVRQLGAQADPAGSGLITVRASIKNAGRQPQPLPLLRVTLQDRFGNRIAARDVAPRFYVPRSVPESSYLAGGQRIDAEMGFVDPGVNAVGFEIDACLPASGGGIMCANDLATR
jgi:hypothetical protein